MTINKALESFKNQNYEEALKLFLEINANGDETPNIFNNIGLCHLSLENYDDAEKFFLKALSLDDKIPQVYLNLADLYYRQEEILKTIEILQNGVYKLPDNVAIRHYLARVYIDDSRYDIAIDQLEAVIDLSPKNYDAYWDLGRTYFLLGVWDRVR